MRDFERKQRYCAISVPLSRFAIVGGKTYTDLIGPKVGPFVVIAMGSRD